MDMFVNYNIFGLFNNDFYVEKLTLYISFALIIQLRCGGFLMNYCALIWIFGCNSRQNEKMRGALQK